MVWWLRQMAHDQEVVGSNPSTIYWMDVSDLLAITLKRKIENKSTQVKNTFFFNQLLFSLRKISKIKN
jgi:hypothetical protein